MKEIVVLSGKGGTGKTTVTAALAHLASLERRLVLADADVDAANLELVVDAQIQSEHEFSGGRLARVDPELCTACDVCAQVCRFGAVLPGEVYEIDTISCEGCAVCFYQCPVEAIRMEPAMDGHWYVSQSLYGPLVHGALRAGRENSGKLVATVKEEARKLVEDDGLLLVDGPPGIGCPVIASLTGCQLALVVTEPTVAGLHDMERIVGVARHFQVPVKVVLNKADLSVERSDEVSRFCEQEGLELIGQIPFDMGVTQAMVQGVTVTTREGPATTVLHAIWARLRGWLEEQSY
ncbi:MAG: ATP-binding protein [Chloroflexia bacterium]|nr:ATP-binding protein [Chloroflexia bacterium]